MKPKNQEFQMVFYGANIPQLVCPGYTHTQPHFSDSLRLFEDHLRPLPGTVPSNLIQFPPCVSNSPLPYVSHFTSLPDPVPRRQWTHRTSKRPSSPAEISTQQSP